MRTLAGRCRRSVEDGGGVVGPAGLDDFGARGLALVLAVGALLLGLTHVHHHTGGGGCPGVELVLLPWDRAEKEGETRSAALTQPLSQPKNTRVLTER